MFLGSTFPDSDCKVMGAEGEEPLFGTTAPKSRDGVSAPVDFRLAGGSSSDSTYT